MPSFFFHLAIDLNLAGDPSPPAPQESSSNPDVTTTSDQPYDLDTPDIVRVTPSCNNTKVLKPTASTSPTHDWRYDKIFSRTVTMAPPEFTDQQEGRKQTAGNIANGISAGPGGLATKGRYESYDPKDEDLGWGIVRLYRDVEETPGLYDEPSSPRHSKNSRASSRKGDDSKPKFQDEDCTTLCILAVPSYLTPSDFLGFVGEKTREEVSHFRMIRTERGNRYMVLMKFRNGKRAREWRRQWNGKAFDGMDAENCHVVFVKSIEFRTREGPGEEASFPDMTNDPFTPSISKTAPSPSTPTLQSSSTSRPSKPVAPPTPALIELPTCPVCLERMDESTGLLTILCQHVFHCSCLQKWRGSGCPVCRYTQHDLHTGKRSQNSQAYTEASTVNECTVCRSDANLWICLICGNIGCGRYDAAHAFSHYEASSHAFAMDMQTQRIWDYTSDGYVHRIVQDKTDGKLLSVNPSTATNDHPPDNSHHSTDHDDAFDDYVPREKLDNINREYTSLLTSQLASQRTYFEEILERAADKASTATATAEQALQASTQTAAQLTSLQQQHDELLHTTLPALEKDHAREARKAVRFSELARKFEREWRDEAAMNESLRERVEVLTKQVGGLEVERDELKEVNRDLGFFISGGERLRGLVGGDGGAGAVGGEEVREGVVSLGAGVGSGGGKVEGGGGTGGKKKKGKK